MAIISQEACQCSPDGAKRPPGQRKPRGPPRMRCAHAATLPSNAASNALAIACLLLPACTASPITVTICPGRASGLKRSRGAAPRAVIEPVAQLRRRKQLRESPASARRRYRAPRWRARRGRSDTRRRSRSRCDRRAPAVPARRSRRSPKRNTTPFISQAGDEIGDVALEAFLVRLDLLEQRRFAGVAETRRRRARSFSNTVTVLPSATSDA